MRSNQPLAALRSGASEPTPPFCFQVLLSSFDHLSSTAPVCSAGWVEDRLQAAAAGGLFVRCRRKSYRFPIGLGARIRRLRYFGSFLTPEATHLDLSRGNPRVRL